MSVVYISIERGGGSFPFLILLKAFRYARKKLSDRGERKRIRLTTIVFFCLNHYPPVSFSSSSLFILERRRSHMVPAGNRVGYLSGKREGRWGGLLLLPVVCPNSGANDVPPPSWRYFRRVSVCLSFYFLQVARRPNFILLFRLYRRNGSRCLYNRATYVYIPKGPGAAASAAMLLNLKQKTKKKNEKMWVV